MAINYTQWGAFAKYSYKQLKWAVVEKTAVREAYVNGQLDESWKAIEYDVSNSFEEFSKEYYVVFE